MKMKKVIATTLAALLLVGATGCGTDANEQRELTETEQAKIAASIPDYSTSDKQFEFFAYSAASDGYWEDYGVEYYCGQDLRNVEQFTMYKEAGLTFMHPQGSIAIQATDNFVYSSSGVKKVLDLAQETGNRVIVPDYRLYGLVGDISNGIAAYESNDEATIAAYADQYGVFTDEGEVDQTALENKLREFMGEYSQHPAFFGVVLPDEPGTAKFTGYGEVYRAIKRVYPNAFQLCNLLPPAGFGAEALDGIEVTEEEIAEFENTTDKMRLARWKKYITYFLEETQIDYLMYDQYPLTTGNVHYLYMRGLQIAAQVCKEKGVDFYLVTQTMTIRGNGSSNNRVISAEDAAWLNNMLLGYGVKTIGYYTYFDRGNTQTETYLDGCSFVTHFGEKTSVYTIMQNVMKQNQQFAPTILSFDYTASAVYSAANNQYVNASANNCTEYGTFAKLSGVSVNQETALVTELYDSQNSRYMYMLQNVVDPEYTTAKSYQTGTLTFNEAYAYAVVWKNGERTVVRLKDNAYTVKQHPGEAVYVIPFNA